MSYLYTISHVLHVINTVVDPNVRGCVELIKMTRANDFVQVDNIEIQLVGMCSCTFQVLCNPSKPSPASPARYTFV